MEQIANKIYEVNKKGREIHRHEALILSYIVEPQPFPGHSGLNSNVVLLTWYFKMWEWKGALLCSLLFVGNKNFLVTGKPEPRFQKRALTSSWNDASPEAGELGSGVVVGAESSLIIMPCDVESALNNFSLLRDRKHNKRSLTKGVGKTPGKDTNHRADPAKVMQRAILP